DTCWSLMIVRARGRTALYQHLLAQGIRTQVHYVPIHTQPYYQDHFDTRPGDYPVAEKYYAQALTLPLYPDLGDDEQDRVIAAVREFYPADEPRAQDRD
ncbi:MAG: DegT/DnrJ/EryC1/StrS family aminotransferase, partial [Candidatus Krumholzibacteria bacterium]|nr:DegT/DnrJ/EryC1/StrS family aminotransferase [Candidatus Krumholzibacteria bacterium]